MPSDEFIDCVNKTTPDPRDKYIVDDILRDRDYRWELNYYHDYRKTSYDLVVCRTKLAIEELKTSIQEYETTLKKIDDDTDRSRLEPTDEKFKKLSAKDKERMNKDYAIAIDGLNSAGPLLEELTQDLMKYEIKQYAELTMGQILRRIRNEFRFNKDMDYLTRGVTFAMEHSYKLRGEVREPYVEKVDLSAW